MKLTDDVDVYLHERGEEPVLVGALRPSLNVGRNLAASSFQYAGDYLKRRDRYEISPDLPLVPGRTYTEDNEVVFGALADAAPDEWGQKIIDANHARRLREDDTLHRSVGDFDYLLGVSDFTRMGALRFKYPDGDWLSQDPGVANIHELDRILAATKRYENQDATDEDVEYLAGIATSPGGARPKANVMTPTGHLALAKLPHSKDELRDVEAWEAVASTIARNAGLRTSPQTLHRVAENNAVLVVRRFDRDDNGDRIGYISAATALGIGKHDSGRRVTYQDFADTIAELASNPDRELREMYGRIALTVLVNNVDDHWRNHGFLRSEGGWRLSPLFDVNPSPRRGVINSRSISDTDDPRERDIRNLAAISEHYGLSQADGAHIIKAVADEVAKWPQVAAELGVPREQVELMAPAFSEEQARRAQELGASAAINIDLAGGVADAEKGRVRAHLRGGRSVSSHMRRPRRPQ